jgi:hypothetical protein
VEEQEKQQQQKPSARLVLFLTSPRGQAIAKCCAFGSLGSIAISALLADYSFWTLPFALLAVLLVFPGSASRTHRRIVQVAIVLWILPINIETPLLLNIGTQTTQQTQMQIQIVKLENIHNKLQGLEAALKKQSLVLQDHANDGSQIAVLFGNQAQTTDSIASNSDDISQYINELIKYTTGLYEYNGRNLANDGMIKRNQDAIDVNEQGIQSDQKVAAILADVIRTNNTIVSAQEYVQPPVWIEQKSCVQGYSCNLPSWQQYFVAGWKRVSEQAFSITWFFWLFLVSGLVVLFFMLPFTKSKASTITYRVLYYGTLLRLNDAGFPEQKRQELGGETQILKVEIRPTFFLRQKKGLTNETQAFLHLIPDPGTTIQDVFLKEIKTKKRVETREVRYDKTTNSIILSMQPLPLKGMRRPPPMQIYAVVDYFTGTLKAQTPALFAWVECVQELRGPIWLLQIGNFFHGTAWWVYTWGAYMSLLLCSYYFFDGIIFPAQWIDIGLIILAIALFFMLSETLLMRMITRRQPRIPVTYEQQT